MLQTPRILERPTEQAPGTSHSSRFPIQDLSSLFDFLRRGIDDRIQNCTTTITISDTGLLIHDDFSTFSYFLAD